ncbi:MAG: ATP-binding protein [Clostridia bacterium]|nr:ATP-binding protein [Clostridia bacterium]
MSEKKPRSLRFYALALVLCLCVFIVLLWLVYGALIARYQSNISLESAEHLSEIGNQIKLYVEDRLMQTWHATEDVANDMRAVEFSDAEALLRHTRTEMNIWDVSDIMFFDDAGNATDEWGKPVSDQAMADAVYGAYRDGRNMCVMDSEVAYTMPVESANRINGGRLTAVSAVQKLSTLLDDMNFTSFNGEAFAYLTRQDGAVISRTSHPDTQLLRDVSFLFDGKPAEYLRGGGENISAVMEARESCVFLCEMAGQEVYVAMMPISAIEEIWYLFYIVPENVVNATLNGLSSFSMAVGMVLMAIVTVLCCTAFLALYRNRSRQFDSEINARERLLDLLVSETRNAYALLSRRYEDPIYETSNAGDILGDARVWLDTSKAHVQVRGEQETENLRRLNEALAAWDEKSVFVSDYIPINVNGARVYIVWHLYPVDGDEFVSIAQDVTRERERENALRSAMLMAESASRAKTEFLSNMSHDIRTPMNAIINMTAFALESLNERDKVQEYLETIQVSSDHLLQLINSVLDMSRIESGRHTFLQEPFDMAECLAEITDIIQPLCESHDHVFLCDLTHVVSKKLIGDKLKLSQIMINLLNNAVKFTPDGGEIRFEATELTSLRPETATFRFVVADTGIGIAKADLEKIFKPFSRVDNTAVQEVEGTGLGLSIAKNFVEAMGGTMRVDSVLGEGTTFTVEIFFKRDEENGEQEKKGRRLDLQAVSFAGKGALLCEDNLVNQKIAALILKKYGFTVDVAANGQEAVDRFTASPAGAYSVIYMDIQMPVMDGYAATAAIRQSAHPQAKTIPIIAMTANVFAEDVEKARAAGMNAHTGKPIDAADLIATTEALLSKEEKNA